nr:hypothetical protein [Tanacetum cinerariifolium]
MEELVERRAIGIIDGIVFSSPTCTDGNKRVLKSVLKLFELEFKWEEAAVSMFHVGSCKVIVLNALGAGHDGLVGKIGPDDGLVHKQWVEMGLFGAVVGSTSGIRTNGEALNKKNHFLYTQELSDMAYTSLGSSSRSDSELLDEEKYKRTLHMLEMESGYYFNMRYFKEVVTNGEWEEVVKNDHPKACEMLRKDLKVFSGINQDLYKKITLLLGLENEQFSKYANPKTARSIMLGELKKLIETNLVFRDKLMYPSFKILRLRILINQSLNWQHQLCKNQKPNPDIRTLLVDHYCGQSQPQPEPNVARAPSPVTNLFLSVVPKLQPGFHHLGAHGLFQAAPAPLPPNLAGWMTNLLVSHPSAFARPIGFGPLNDASKLKCGRTPPTNTLALEYRTTDEHAFKRTRAFGISDEVNHPPINVLPVVYSGQSNGQSLYSSDDLPKVVVMTLDLMSSSQGEACSEKFQGFQDWFLFNAPQTTLANDYTASINRVTWSPDGKLFGVAYSKSLVQIYSYHGGDDIRNHLEIEVHAGSVNDLAFGYPNKILSIVTCGDDKLIKEVLQDQILRHRFLDEEKYKRTLHMLEMESRYYFNMRYFKEVVTNGDWEEVVKYLQGFTKVKDNRYAKTARSIMLEELKKLFEANHVFRDKLMYPSFKSQRLRTLINQSLNWQHQLCKNQKLKPEIRTMVTVQPVQERQSSFATGTSGTKANILGICRNNTVLLVEAQGSSKVLNEEESEFLADLGVTEGLVTQTVITHNVAYQVDDLDAYDSDCDDFSTTKAVLIDNLSSYGSDVLFEIRPTLYDGSVIVKETNVILIADSEETLMLEEESQSKMLLKQSDPKVLEKKVNMKPINYAELRMYKLDRVTLAPKDKNNRETRIYYLKHTMEEAAILREIVEQAKSLNLLDSASCSACKYVKLIQELLGYVRDTCPNIHKPSEKLVAVTPINKNKIVRITTTNRLPLREPIPFEVVAQESVVTKVYTRRPKVIQIVLWYLDSGCSKHMTGDRSQLINFVYKFLGTVKFGNDQIAKIMGINEKKYILVVVDDYSRFTWVKFLASKDEAPDFIIKFLKMIQVGRNMPVRNIRTDNGTEFVNQTLRSYYESVVLVAAAPRTIDLADSPVSMSIDQDAPSTRVAVGCKSEKLQRHLTLLFNLKSCHIH